jgi:hypothetical protein
MAFIAPGLVKAAVKGWLPPASALPSAQCEWSRQYERLGLAQPRLRGFRSNELAAKNAEIGRSARRNGIFGRGDRPPKRTRYRYRRPDTKKKVTGKAANRGLSSRVSGYLEISRLRGGGRSRSRTGLQASKFPANREINREFCKIQRSAPNLRAWTRANPKACNKIPYSTEQGIFAREQGICTREQGI